jgi:hypothetical protein
LGLKREAIYVPVQTYLQWEDKYTIQDQKLILTYQNKKDASWDSFLLNSLMSNQMFDEYYVLSDEMIAVSFDMNCIAADYLLACEGKYGKLSKFVKGKIRDYYGYNSPEWAYMETFLYPSRYVATYSRLLAVDEEHIKFTGELCDPPNLDQETLKLKPNAKINDVVPVNLEQNQNLQTNSY